MPASKTLADLACFVVSTLFVPASEVEAARYEIHAQPSATAARPIPSFGKGSCLSSECRCVVFLTRDEAVYGAALAVEGTGQVVNLKWRGAHRVSGAPCSVAYGLEAGLPAGALF